MSNYELEQELSCKQMQVEDLRQQLADRDEQISDLTISSDTYFAERNSARDVWRRASKDRDELRQQLAAALAACKQKDEALECCKQLAAYPEDVLKVSEEALAIQPDDIALKAWLGEPVAFKYQNANTDHIYLCWEQSHGGRNWIPLYAPKVLKGL